MTRRARRAALVVLDGVGIGEAPDAAAYGDAGSDTLGNVARTVGGLELPFLDSLGLGCCRPLEGMRCEAPTAAHGVAVPRSAGKDSTAGHWEICGVLLERPFPTFPGGFPDEVLEAFSAATGRGVLGNKSASGTAIIEEYGREHREGGDWILYTSVDSVFQIAAHEEVVPLEELYTACRVAREEVLVGAYALSRVIARPFVGEPGHYRRTANRRDFSLPPPGDSLLDRLAGAGIPRAGVGKVDDLFAGRGITSRHTGSNLEALRLVGEALDGLDRGLVFANVIEFDQEWGHRNDVAGFHRGLVELDGALPELVARLEDEDLLILTADHGNDPTTPSTDHSREVVPVLAVGPRVRPVPLGTRSTFADVGATVAEYLGVELDVGTSFLSQVIS
jgi:phosphopentomutase